MANKFNPSENITGYNIYHVKNQTIYYNNLNKTAYIITNKKARSFSTWQLKGSFCVMFTCVLIILKLNIFVSIGIGLIAYGVSTAIFNLKYLKTLTKSTIFVKPKSEGLFKDIANRSSHRSIKIMFVMFILIAVIMFIFGEIIISYQEPIRTINIVIILISIGCACAMGYILKLMKKD